MTGQEDMDALAAEYVIGTLDRDERTVAARRLESDGVFRSAVAEWERRLAPLSELAVPVAPPANLASEISRRLERVEAVAAPSGASNVANLDLERKLRRWRGVALATSALAASLAVVVGLREVRPRPETNYVAVFQKDDASPSFVMSVDLATRTLSVKRVAAEVPAGKTYQLWIASDKLGVGPQSLGLVEQGSDVKKTLADIDPSIVQNALFGVSLEPAGGSPTGKPTGSVFHARLIPTSSP